ncbi:hypothetical protein C5U38_04485 [Escherichia fergusonii]|nr:hypothetical protein C5U38_04485 [Escherichia fergusonii]
MCCVCVRSPQSLTYVSSWGFTLLSPSCNSNYLEYEKMRALKARYNKGRFPCPVIFYFLARSSSIATAGSTLPSTNSRNAPPPVEM